MNPPLKTARSRLIRWAPVAATTLAYVVVFAPVARFAGPAVAALSFVPVILAARQVPKRVALLAAFTGCAVNSALFAIVGPLPAAGAAAKLPGALLGGISLFIAADLVGRVRQATIRLQSRESPRTGSWRASDTSFAPR